ncbi:dynactin, putative [Talaromyces stipitatus ATCC 10500]|uniref:Dynactin, putative n=1 Tax=Talaromyces stipitatus (strain ATCC 10500 / CBS 375.48 / QM 6759 / NRRL 1006) TaxID=441959 RepID=B8MRP8_TALSN|nr:dynactin, putative [Talaromyces stipitatus ATCC 10500]EED13205.1 dynactin, putative [Talaromyces stipitatus ATCC 10500]
MVEVSVGQVISLLDGRQATVRFVGSTHFASGDWIGVELDDASGKNDGSVQGERYFDCEHGFGMFIRPSAVSSILAPAPKRESKVAPAKGAGVGKGTTPGLPSSRRTGSVATVAPKRQSVTSSPSPAPREMVVRNLRSPTKSPVKQLATSRPSSMLSKTTSAVKPRASVSGRTSMGPPATGSVAARSRQSLMGAQNKLARPGAPSSTSTSTSSVKRLSVRPSITKNATDESSSRASGASEPSGDNDELDQEAKGEDVSPTASRPEHGAASSRPSATLRSASQSTSIARELEDLKTKLKVMEKKRAEDRERLKGLERLQAEKDKYEGIIQKLQAKYQPQQVELTDLKKKLRETEAKLEQAERIQAEHESILEIAALDREMAEETAEAFKAECQDLKLRLEELQLELEVLRDENEELNNVMSPEDKSSQGWLQMEKTNERLREALIRLRDMTQQTEAELRAQIKELEDDLEEYTTVKAEYDSVKKKLLASESNVDDLKQQLETALGAEEMIEELADKNMRYQEEINELKAAIEDLESLKEISDELELNHVETEKQLQEEIDYRESIFNEQSRKVAQQDEIIEDLEYTLARFRELVTNLQSDLEDMRASQQLTETEANELSTRSRAMMDLNLRLQASVEKAQSKTIEIELGRMEAEESSEHLAIVQSYLPEYYDTERDSVRAFLRAKRVESKALLIQNTVRERLSEQSQSSSAQENIFASYEVIENALWISRVCERFVKHVTSCSPEQFGQFGVALYELEPVERTVNNWIDSLRKNEIDEKKCALELQRSIALLTHLAETLIPTELATYADETLTRAIMIQTYLEHVASALTQLRNLLHSKLPASEGEDAERLFFFNKTDALVGQARGLKVVITKVIRSLEELNSRSLALSDGAAEPFESVEAIAKKLAELVRELGEDVMVLLGEEGRTEPFTYEEISARMVQTAATLAQGLAPEGESNDALSLLTLGLKTLTSQLEELSNHTSDLAHTAEFERGKYPWIARAEELKSHKASSPDAEEEIRRLKNELSETSTALGVKDKTIEEQAMKVELLESRMREATKKASVVKDFETKIETMQEKEGQLQGMVEKLSKDLQSMQSERDDYKQRFERAKQASGNVGATITAEGVVVDSEATLAAMRENEALRSEINSLQAAVRFLREDNCRANLLDPYSVQRTMNMYSWLDAPLTQPKPSSQREAQYARAAESRDVLNHLLKLTKETPITDLASTLSAHQKRSAWRPTKSTYRYKALQNRENYEQWSEWKNEVAMREKEEERILAAKAERILREQQAKRRAPPRGHAKTPSAGFGMMGRAWTILGMQNEVDGKEGGIVEIVSDV